LTISHSGRGVFSVGDWKRVARDPRLAYPENGHAIGIGPIEGQVISVVELDSDRPVQFSSSDGRLVLYCETSGIEIVTLN
jgi:hypothetical protein